MRYPENVAAANVRADSNVKVGPALTVPLGRQHDRSVPGGLLFSPPAGFGVRRAGKEHAARRSPQLLPRRPAGDRSADPQRPPAALVAAAGHDAQYAKERQRRVTLFEPESPAGTM